MSSRGIKFNFYPGESVLCFEPDPTKARVIYEAKILDTTVYKDLDGKKKPGYHIHFLRWNNSWDRIVGEQLVLKTTEENKALMKQLAEVARKSNKNKNRRKRIKEILTEAFNGSPPFDDLENDEGNTTDTNDTGDESATESDSIGSDCRGEEQRRSQRLHPQVDIEIPDTLKAVLDKDYFAVNQDRKCVKLPAEINVVTVLESFVKSFMMDFWSPDFDRSYLCHNPPKISIERILPMCKEFVDGVRICFDFVLPVILLYEGERDQHTKIMNVFKNKSPAKQKIPAEDSPLLRSPRSRSSDQQSSQTDEPWPKLPKLSPNVANEEEDLSFTATPRRVTRSRVPEMSKKSETETASVKTEPGVNQNEGKSDSKCETLRQVRRRRASDRQDEGLRRRALRSYRKSSEDSSDSEQSKPDTIMSEPSKPGLKNEKSERPPPLLIPCNLSARQNGKDNKPLEKGAPGSTDSVGDNGREEILANIQQWQLAPPDALSQLPTPPCIIYGAQHLLRLFVKLPGLLVQMDLDENRLGVLKKLIQQFLMYLSEHVTELFPDTAYGPATDV